MKRLTKKQQILAETLLKVKEELKEEIIKKRITDLARGMKWREKIKLVFKI